MDSESQVIGEAFDELPGVNLTFDPESLELVPHPGGQGILAMRPYQVEASDAIYESWLDHRAVLCVLPTGMGKTVLAAEVILRWPRDGRALFIAHVQELIYQAQETIGRHTDEVPNIEMGVHREVTSGHPVLDRPRCVVASIQTLSRRIEKFRPEDFDLIIFDEFHHAAAPSYRRVWEYFKEGNPRIKALGITATPRRSDKVTLACIAETCAYEMEIREAVDEGWLVPIHQKYIVVDGLDFSKCRTVAKDLNEGDLEEAMMGGVEHEGMTPEEVEELIVKQERMLHSVADPAVKESNGRPAIVFCVTVAHATRMAEILRRYPGVTAEVVHGETPDEQRKDIIRRFKGGQIQFLTGVGCFTEGFDAPNVQVIVMARPTKSQSLYIQMLGRGTRPLPGLVDRYLTPELRQEAIANSLKPCMTVLDFVGNSGKHKLVSTADVLAGDMPPDLVEAAVREIQESGKAEEIRSAAWRIKKERDEEEERRRKEAEERRKQAIALEEANRKRIRAEAQYRAREINPFGHQTAPERVQPKYRGGATDGQVNYLVRLGVQRETAMGWTKSQAGAVISKLQNQTGSQFIVRFGKHQGKTLEWVMNNDLQWLRWAASNLTDETFQANVRAFRAEVKNRQ